MICIAEVINIGIHIPQENPSHYRSLFKNHAKKKSHPPEADGIKKIGNDLLSHKTQYHRRKQA